MDPMRRLAGALVPSLCVACRRPCGAAEVLCAGCDRELRAAPQVSGDPPAGLDACWSLAPYRGVARELVTALKFGRMLPVAEAIAERIAGAVPAAILDGALVPVAPAPRRALLRGFDPAAELAMSLRRMGDLPLVSCLERRGEARQVGRKRAERLAAPPAVQVRGPAPARTVLVDDVITTGATLSACASALRAAGGRRVSAVTFARRL